MTANLHNLDVSLDIVRWGVIPGLIIPLSRERPLPATKNTQGHPFMKVNNDKSQKSCKAFNDDTHVMPQRRRSWEPLLERDRSNGCALRASCTEPVTTFCGHCLPLFHITSFSCPECLCHGFGGDERLIKARRSHTLSVGCWPRHLSSLHELTMLRSARTKHALLK